MLNADTPPTPLERWLSKAELAAHYSVARRWVERRVNEGMPSRMIGSQRRFKLSDVDRWLDEQAVQSEKAAA